MKFSEKYSQLAKQKTLHQLVVTSVYANMALENQIVSEVFLKDAVKKITHFKASK